MYIYSIMNNLSIEDLYGKSNNDIVVELGKRFRDYRIALRLTQKNISEHTGLSVMTIARFEKGEGSAIRLDNFVALMRAIECLAAIAESIPDIPASLYESHAADDTVKHRVRRRKNEK